MAQQLPTKTCCANLADQKHPYRSQKQSKVSKSSKSITDSSLPGPSTLSLPVSSAPSIASVSVGSTEDAQNHDDAMLISGDNLDNNQCCLCFDVYDNDKDTEWVQCVCKRCDYLQYISKNHTSVMTFYISMIL